MLARMLCLAALFATPVVVTAQSAGDAGPWSVRARIALGGSSFESEPAGYTVYSGVGIEVAVLRRSSTRTALELSFRTESREVDNEPAGGGKERLGSLEMLPVTLTLQWRPRARRAAALQPYVGAGLNATITWEESGALDTAHPQPTLGPALQLGIDRALSRGLLFNLDVRWHRATLDIEHFGAVPPEVRIDPLTLSAGFGFRL